MRIVTKAKAIAFHAGLLVLTASPAASAPAA